MKIICHTMDQFMDAIAGCVQRGLTFAADATELSITLLGGY